MEHINYCLRRRNEFVYLDKFLREAISEWREHSWWRCSGKCVITGEKGQVVHHKRAFCLIVEEAFEKLGLENRIYTNRYTDAELKLIAEEVWKLHNYYGEGVCLTGEIHNEFHNIFGKRVTEEDFEKFEVAKREGIKITKDDVEQNSSRYQLIQFFM